VFDAQSGALCARSERLVSCLSDQADLAESGRLLDVGCGNGAFLRAFSSSCPGWKLFGSELSDKYREDVKAIEGVQGFFSGDLAQIDEQFKLISLIHVLEHIESPVQFLSVIRKMLKPGGKVLIEVPYYVDNPFDLVIADHASHFTPGSLSAVAERSGFQIEILSTNWVTKEISCVLNPAVGPADKHPNGEIESGAEAARQVKWLTACRRDLGRPENADQFGIFGTSIGANWLHEELRIGRVDVDFFVDQDPNRIGHHLLDRPIHSPQEIPAGSVVAVPLAPIVAIKVAEQLSELPCKLVTPGMSKSPDHSAGP